MKRGRNILDAIFLSVTMNHFFFENVFDNGILKPDSLQEKRKSWDICKHFYFSLNHFISFNGLSLKTELLSWKKAFRTEYVTVVK